MWPHRMSGWQKVAAVAGAISAIYAAAAVLNAPVPKPAWAWQVKQLAGEIQSVKQITIQQALESAELRWVRLRREADNYRSRSERVPDWLEAEIRKLERRINSFEAELRELQ